jgi:hypothetical protein
MAILTVTISEDRLQRLQNLAKQFNVPAEELLRVSFEEFVALPKEDFQKALEYALEKNKEIYKKLT